MVFTDADILPDQTWLSQLIPPIASRTAAASSGYRWLLPADRRGHPQSRPRSISPSPRRALGATEPVLGRVDGPRPSGIGQIDLPAIWNRPASDDLTLTAALRARDSDESAAERARPSPVAYSRTSLFSFARRPILCLLKPMRHDIGGWQAGPCVCRRSLQRLPLQRHSPAGGGLRASSWPPHPTPGATGHSAPHCRSRVAETAINVARTTISFALWAWPLIHLVHVSAFLASCVGNDLPGPESIIGCAAAPVSVDAGQGRKDSAHHLKPI